MLPSVCFEIGRFTQTQSSWTVLRYCSRKWMSGQVYALASAKDRQLVTSLSALRIHPSARGPASPLDFYLSWMSPVYLPLNTCAGAQLRNRALYDVV
jgi:hypothetical protein